MRRLSTRLPVCVTACAFVLPGCYLLNVLFQIGKPEMSHLTQFAGKLIGGLIWAMIAWLVYGVACLLTPSARDTTAGKVRAPTEEPPVSASR